MKACTKCGSGGPFYKDSTRIDGLSYCCKPCELKRTQKYKDDNAEDYREQSRTYRKQNPDKCRAIQKRWLGNNPSKSAEYSKRYAKKYPDRVREKGIRWYAKNDMTPKRQEQKFKARLKPFGLTPESYRAMLECQSHKCAICGATESGSKAGSRLFVDHNHKTNKVRALLCHNCNAMLGHAKESVSRLLGGIAYLKKHNGQGDLEL